MDTLLTKEIRDGQALATKIHAAADHLTDLIREARENKIMVHLDSATGFSASNGSRVTAKITASIVFDEKRPSFHG